ncbi:NAD-dependent epimerase/dehydratase family protein [bacterium]|nr:NAD-dependent epimerase/dehydratase family protein [bacterium]
MELSNKKQTVLVTGAGGFIGLNVVKEYVKQGWFVYALVHKNIPDELKNLNDVQIIRGDVTSKEQILGLKIDVDVVAHVAGLASDIGSDKTFSKINYEPVKYLSEIPKVKFVYVSSSDVYGIKDLDNADENSPLVEFPKNPYPRYKIKSENWLRENCKVPFVIIRPAAVYGEGDKTLEKRFVDFLKCSPFIVHFGKWKGQNRWPLANVKNVAATIVAVSQMNKYDGEAVSIIDSDTITIEGYYRTLAEKYFPEKHYKTITFPFWFGKLLGFISTALSNILKLRHPIYDPTFYAVHHVSSNLDMSSKKMEQILQEYRNNQ